MSVRLGGDLDGSGLRVGVIVARFNGLVTGKLLKGCLEALAEHGVRDEDVTVATVPGSFEIPVVAQTMGRFRQVRGDRLPWSRDKGRDRPLRARGPGRLGGDSPNYRGPAGCPSASES